MQELRQSKRDPSKENAAWRAVEEAILQERFDDLPDLVTAKEFAEFAGEPIALIRDAIRNGDVVATRDNGLSYVPKAPNARLIMYRLREDSRAGIPPRPEPPTVQRLSTDVAPELFDAVMRAAERNDLSVRDVIEEAVRTRWIDLVRRDATPAAV